LEQASNVAGIHQLTLASLILFTLLSKNNSELDSKVLQTLEFVEVVLPLFFWFCLSKR
jgi:hypothetical protein